MFFFFTSRRRHTRYWRDWSSDVCSSDLPDQVTVEPYREARVDPVEPQQRAACRPVIVDSELTSVLAGGVIVRHSRRIDREGVPHVRVGGSAKPCGPGDTGHLPAGGKNDRLPAPVI